MSMRDSVPSAGQTEPYLFKLPSEIVIIKYIFGFKCFLVVRNT